MLSWQIWAMAKGVMPANKGGRGSVNVCVWGLLLRPLELIFHASIGIDESIRIDSILKAQTDELISMVQRLIAHNMVNNL